MKSFFRLVFRTLILLVVALVSALTAMRFAIHVGEVAVPGLIGKTPGEARRVAEDNGLRFEVERQYYSAQVPEGRILSQAPAAGTKVRRGWRVRVAQSMGPQRLPIPSVIGQTERAAEMNIRRRGLELGATAQVALPDAPADRVVAQSPPPNASGVSAPKINLLVTNAGQPQAFVMPNFVGQPLGSVKPALQDAGLRVGSITASAQTGSSPASIVVSHSPAAGEKVSVGAAVNFEVQ